MTSPRRGASGMTSPRRGASGILVAPEGGKRNTLPLKGQRRAPVPGVGEEEEVENTHLYSKRRARRRGGPFSPQNREIEGSGRCRDSRRSRGGCHFGGLRRRIGLTIKASRPARASAALCARAAGGRRHTPPCAPESRSGARAGPAGDLRTTAGKARPAGPPEPG